MLPDFISKEPVDKGWSGDKKFHVVLPSGAHALLRISPPERQAHRQQLFDLASQCANLGVPMCRPLDFGSCDEGVYMLFEWVHGQDAEDVIPEFPENQQYALGVAAGQALQKIHRIPAPETQPDWAPRFNAKMDRKILGYQNGPLHMDGADYFVRCIEQNRHLLRNRPQTFQHGDFHIGNMMMQDGNLVIIDFDRFDFGDPWEEFNRIVWCAQKAPLFAKGQVDGYFDGKPPELFWRLLSMYISSNTLSSLPWAAPFGEEQIQVMIRQARDVLSWYSNMQEIIPSWYRKT